MEIINPIAQRRSIRKYKDLPVADHQIKVLLEAASLAPSGNNTQPWQFIIVRSLRQRRQIAEICHNQSWMVQAPVHLVCVADIRSRLKGTDELVLTEDSPEPELKLIIRDTAIAIEHIVLQAQAMDLATCWVAYFEQHQIRPFLAIPDDKYVVAVLTLGYPEKIPRSRQRKAVDQMIYLEEWGKTGSL